MVSAVPPLRTPMPPASRRLPWPSDCGPSHSVSVTLHQRSEHAFRIAQPRRGYSRLKPLDSPFGSLADLHAPVPTDRARSQPAPTSLWKQGTRVRDSYVGSPDAVLKDLPSGLRIHFGTSSSSDAGNLLVLDQVAAWLPGCLAA